MATAAVGAAIAAAAVVAGSQSAAAATRITVSGTATCASGRHVVGVWLDSTKGGSGWASWTPMPGRANVAFYSRTLTYSGTATAVRPVVGCGNTRKSWGSSNAAATRTTKGSYVYNVTCKDPRSGKGSCTGGALPARSGANTFARGYCTWGAAELWRKAAGTYPAWSGNANAWATNAAGMRFTVSSSPHARAVAVSRAGQSGHVMWVTRVWTRSGATYFHVREMNYGGQLGRWHERDVRYDGSYRFIVAPPGAPVNS